MYAILLNAVHSKDKAKCRAEKHVCSQRSRCVNGNVGSCKYHQKQYFYKNKTEIVAVLICYLENQQEKQKKWLYTPNGYFKVLFCREFFNHSRVGHRTHLRLRIACHFIILGHHPRRYSAKNLHGTDRIRGTS